MTSVAVTVTAASTATNSTSNNCNNIDTTAATCSKQHAAAAATTGPITDKIQAKPTITIKTLSQKSKTNSKIPHPQPYPLGILLANKTNQFRRSAAQRMRANKANLLFYNNNKSSNNNSSSNYNNIKRQHNYNNKNNSTNSHSHHCNMDHAINTRACNEPVTHETLIAGRVSPRRKLVLNHSQANNSLPTTTTTKTTTTTNDNSSSRSLSLQTNQITKNKNNNKTEAKPCDAVAATPDATPKDDVDGLAKSSRATSAVATAAAGKDDDVQEQQQLRNKEVTALELKKEVNEGHQKQDINEQNKETLKEEPTQDTSKMSLNLNGLTTSTTAATAATSTITATTASTATTNLRPATLATGSLANHTSSKATDKTVKTPKTPTTPLQSNHNHHHHNHHQQHYLKKQSETLPSVPETKLTPRTPPVTPDSPSTYLDDDLDSLYSFATTTSGRSTMSCEHPYVARNGTTFSGRKMKYVVHCSNYAGQVGPDYLTPTQRAQRQLRRLKELLCVARQDLEQKDSEILRLTREVVELRLFKASLSSPEERSASSDAVTVREAELKTSQDVSPIVDMVDEAAAAKSSPRHHMCNASSTHHHHQQLHNSEMQSSFADSGHFEDLTTSSMHSKDSYAAPHTHDMACGSDDCPNVTADDESHANSYELQRQELIRMYEQRIEELIRTQDTASSEMKRSHNDKVEALLQKLAECNTRYADIVPDYEHAKERIRELEKQLEDLQRKLTEHEEKQNKMYLHMYQKGQEAERIARADQALELAHRAPSNKVSINELLHQLQSTQDELENIRAAECRNESGGNHALLTAKEAISLWVLGARKTIYRRLLDAQKNRTHVDPEVTLQFLKSAVYYFLTDKENSQGHLQAIESILEFTEAERQQIKAHLPK